MAKPTELYRVKRDGVTVGGKVYRAGDTVGYTDLSMANRDKTWEAMAENDKFEVVDGEQSVVAVDTAESPAQPQGDPDGPLAGDSPKARAAKQFKNLETSGALSQAAGTPQGGGSNVEALAEKADAEEKFRGEANPAAKVEPTEPEKVSAEPVTEQPSPSRAAKPDEEKEDEKTAKASKSS